MDYNFYTKIEKDPTQEVSLRITEKLIQMKHKGPISEKNFEFLNPKECKHRQCYLLPKIYKMEYLVDQSVAQ